VSDQVNFNSVAKGFIMNRDHARMLTITLTVLVGFGGLTGCTNQRLVEERDALWTQNQELQDELDRTRAALDAAQSEPMPISVVAPPQTATGFESVSGVEAFRSGGTITVRVPGDVLFSSGKVALKSSAKQTLSQIAAIIQREHPASTIRVEGYTDTDPIRKSKWKDNLELSLQRAAAVHRHLQQQGISPDRMYAAGFGESQARQSKAKSRRVEIVVVQQE